LSEGGTFGQCLRRLHGCDSFLVIAGPTSGRKDGSISGETRLFNPLRLHNLDDRRGVIDTKFSEFFFKRHDGISKDLLLQTRTDGNTWLESVILGWSTDVFGERVENPFQTKEK
jgi:hypothetical protein